MRIPEIVLHAGPISVPAHLLFESLAYAIGFAIYRRNRNRHGDILEPTTRSSVIVAAILGAAIGSKVLAWLEDPAALAGGFQAFWPGGKTIVGALLGGTVAVEWTKRRLDVRARTGDLFAVPIAAGIIVGRVGCLLGGVNDHTAGNPASVPWAVDFGDGIPRHPTQLYDILFLGALILLLQRLESMRLANGDLYRLFLFSYLAWRLVIDFLKPDPAFAGLASIQWCCLAGVFWYSRDIVRIARELMAQRARVTVNG
ncbi:MAG TPA: prolipoprotein diacylglyceryl transferase family protein [Bryobacteraceae bacterium]|nr:prolipoprotein diacylglyceryl transferase family protein [Bryobacteraceae bacterium]